ncbi:TetR/AcrR family transcriptional regulator [Novosphingobium huizhouense]|uniref:TetR/AcrR family transcriptional regulator n=1 Tax=Novosphingobium huizhouense TaxID=2866625 RepID=UPI001CD8BD57|nr:TetR/AcrR family transcriptional regulator [Novosphingobium huizhouense]
MPAPVDHEEKRKAIAGIAADLIADGGLEAATIRQVAARAGFSTTAVTHYFANKRAMLLAAYRHMAESTQRRFDALAADSRSDPLSRLEILLPIDEDGRRAWRVYFQFWPLADHDAELADEQRWWSANAVGLARETLKLAYPAIDDIDLKATMALSALQGIAMQALFDPDNWPASRQRALWRINARLIIAGTVG